ARTWRLRATAAQAAGATASAIDAWSPRESREQMKDHEYTRTFSFGPIERRGLVGALRPSQAVVLIGASVCAVLAVRALPAGSGFVVALLVIAVAAGIAFAPVRGRSV